MLKTSVLIFLIQGLVFFTMAQKAEIYFKNPKIKDGIYITHQQFLNNSPVSKSNIITTEFLLSPDFFFQVLKSSRVYFYNAHNQIKNIKTNQIWGYCNNGNLYIMYNTDFHKLSYLANYAPFLASEEIPYTSFEPTVTLGNNYTNLYYEPAYTTNETVQMLIDIKNNKFIKAHYKNVEILLKKDSVLYEEYRNLRRRKKKKLIYQYIRLFNERNPLFL